MTFARSAVRAIASVLLLAAALLAVPLAAAQSAAAQGPRNEKEAAVCRHVLGTFLGFAGRHATEACAVQPEDAATR
ncbi:hypothetical protein GCM10009639_17350 [Kitasatospora putterlickiae]|uniref:Uncharacterized protein n=1 Tax=Kitasatospora putterlickiae TaxID=221725 RepID=A0ABN1XT62_9ACTN